MKICSLCNDKYEGFGNNAAPFEGRCCDVCAKVYVLPTRSMQLTNPKVMTTVFAKQAKTHATRLKLRL